MLNDARLQLFLPTSLKLQLEELSKATGAPLSELVRRFIIEGLSRLK